MLFFNFNKFAEKYDKIVTIYIFRDLLLIILFILFYHTTNILKKHTIFLILIIIYIYN